MDFDSWGTKNNCDHFHSLDSWLHVRIKALFATDDWRGLFDSASEDGGEDDEEDELMESDSDEEESELEEESDASEDQESDGEDATAPTENAAKSKQA